MSSENEREAQADDGEGEHEGTAASAAGEPSAAEPSAPRNRAERRAVAKAARRGRQAVLAADGATVGNEDGLDPETNLIAPTTSIGGGPVAIPEVTVGPKRPKVPPRTMSKGTGDVDGVPEWVRRAGEGFSARRNTVVTGVLVFCAVVGGVWAWQAMRTRKAAEAGEALTQALDAFSAAAQRGDVTEPPRFGPSFSSEEERLREASTRFRRAGERFPDSRTAPLAQLGQATSLYLQGRYAEARPIYQSLLGKDLAGMESQAIEGLGFTLEALGDLDGALGRFRELQSLQDGAYRDQAQLYQARVLVRRGDNDRAKEQLKQIIERIGTAAAADPTAVASIGLRDQALQMLRDIAPTDPLILQRDRDRAVGRPEADEHGSGGGLPSGLPPELLRQLQERMRRTKQGG